MSFPIFVNVTICSTWTTGAVLDYPFPWPNVQSIHPTYKNRTPKLSTFHLSTSTFSLWDSCINLLITLQLPPVISSEQPEFIMSNSKIGFLDSILPTPTNKSQTPTGCPRIQLNSNTIYYLQIESDSTRTYPARLPYPKHIYLRPAMSPGSLCFRPAGHGSEMPTTLSNSECQSQVQIVSCSSDWLAINQRFPQRFD